MSKLITRIREFIIGKGRKNMVIRHFLSETCQEQRHNNCFAWGSLRIQLDPDSPIDGVEFPERVYVSIYDPHTDTMMQFSVPVESVEFEENALWESSETSIFKA